MYVGIFILNLEKKKLFENVCRRSLPLTFDMSFPPCSAAELCLKFQVLLLVVSSRLFVGEQLFN